MVRDSTGKTIFAYSIPLGPDTSNYAEAATMLYGLRWCLRNEPRHVWAETDSLLLTNCIKKVRKTPWKITSIVENIRLNRYGTTHQLWSPIRIMRTWRNMRDYNNVHIREGIGGVARNDSGNLVMAFSIPVQCHINNQAEAMDAKYGIDWCKRSQHQQPGRGARLDDYY